MSITLSTYILDIGESLKTEMGELRPRKCEICGTKEFLEMHHLQYKKWHGVTIEDHIWLCEEHRIITIQAYLTKI